MKEYLYTIKTNLTQAQAEQKIKKIMKQKIDEATKIKYKDLVELLESDLNNFLKILNELYSGTSLEKVEEMYYSMDTAARDDFIIFCKIETENHKPFFSGCLSVDDLKMKLVKDKMFRYTEDCDGSMVTLTLKSGLDFEKSMKFHISNYTVSEVKHFCYDVLNEIKKCKKG